MAGDGASREEPRAAAAATPPQRHASPRVVAVGVGVLALLIAAIVVVVGATGGDSDDQASSPSDLKSVDQVAALFRGIPQSGTTLGDPSAPVTMVEYVDLQCPFCQEFITGPFPTIVEKYVRSGELQVQARGLAFIGPDSERGMKAAQAAALQDRMFEFMDLLYYNQGAENGGWLSDDMVRNVAGAIDGVDVDKLVADAGSAAIAAKLAADAKAADADKVTGTPTLLIGPTGGELTKISGSELATVEKAIAAAGSQQPG